MMLSHLPAAEYGLVIVCEHRVVGQVVGGPASLCGAQQPIIQLLEGSLGEHLQAQEGGGGGGGESKADSNSSMQLHCGVLVQQHCISQNTVGHCCSS